MRPVFKFVLAMLATVGLISTSAIAQASPFTGTSITLNVSPSNTLDGSSIDGFDPNGGYFFTLIIADGYFTWDPNTSNSGASLTASMVHVDSPVIQLAGNPGQFIAAMSEIKINGGCTAGNTTIYASISNSSYIQNPLNGHFYNALQTADTFDNQTANASAAVLGDSTATYGYLATIENDLENKIATYLGNAPSWIGASDVNSEGDWVWTGGPETGNLFYQGQGDQDGAAVNESTVFWGRGEPNNWNGSENYAVINEDGTWSDSEDNSFGAVVEWGGQAGDVLDDTSVLITTASTSFTSNGAFGGGDGTQNTPWQINNAEQFAAIARCGTDGAYYEQSNSFVLDNWQGLGDYNHPFVGHYDGDGNEISFTNTLYNHAYAGLFNVIGLPSLTVDDVSVRNLLLSGDVQVDGEQSIVGILAGQATNATINNIEISGSLTGGFDDAGLAVGYMTGSNANEVRVMGQLNSTTSNQKDYIGGAFGYVDGSSSNLISNSSFYGAITFNGGTRMFGGLIGQLDTVLVSDCFADTTITIPGWSIRIGGLIGRAQNTNITNSWANNNFSAPIGINVGGLVGTASNSNLIRSYSKGTVAGVSTVGGLVGESGQTTYTNTYSNAAVSGEDAVGALIGMVGGGAIWKSYARGHVTANVSTMGWYGAGTADVVEDTYWIPEEVGVDAANSPVMGTEATMTTDQAKTIGQYPNWDIDSASTGDSVWVMCAEVNDGYPYLWDTAKNAGCSAVLTNTPAPTIAGSGAVGSALTAVTGTWDNGVTFTYQWKANGTDIAGTQTSTYTPVASDAGKTITVTVTGAKPGYPSVSVDSSNSVVVTASSATTGGPSNPVVTPSNGAYVMSGDTGFSWNRSKGQLGFKVLSIYTGPIKGTLTFKSGGKNYTCKVSFGILKKQAKSKALTFKSPFFCSSTKEKVAAAALKKITKNTVVKIVTMRENHAPTTYKKIKVINRTIYIKLG